MRTVSVLSECMTLMDEGGWGAHVLEQGGEGVQARDSPRQGCAPGLGLQKRGVNTRG